jgi:hypothetical protein
VAWHYWIAAAYFIFMLAFGFGYAAISPEQFYHPYIQYEPDSQQNLSALSSVLVRDFIEPAAAPKLYKVRGFRSPNIQFSRTGSRFDIKYLYPTHLFYEPQTLAAVQVLDNQGPTNSRPIFLNVDVPVQSVGQSDARVSFVAHNLNRCDMAVLGLVYKDLVITGVDTYRADVDITSDDAVLLRSVPLEQSGEAPPQENRFLRMMHLSASTITTTGFGDIVPLTTLTRSLVLAEECLGIFLAGLFISVIFKRMNRQ